MEKSVMEPLIRRGGGGGGGGGGPTWRLREGRGGGGGGAAPAVPRHKPDQCPGLDQRATEVALIK